MECLSELIKNKIIFVKPQTNTNMQKDDLLYADLQLDSFLNSTEVPAHTETTVSVSPAEVEQIKATLYSMKDTIDTLLRSLSGNKTLGKIETTKVFSSPNIEEGQVIEGVFSGEHMVGADGKEYPVPANYASKSKLVEGDMMKLTISPRGTFIYKQIGPIARQRVRGELLADPQLAQWSVLAGGRVYKILTASVTFHKGQVGDDVILLIPEDGESQWGAVENIIKK